MLRNRARHGLASDSPAAEIHSAPGLAGLALCAVAAREPQRHANVMHANHALILPPILARPLKKRKARLSMYKRRSLSLPVGPRTMSAPGSHDQIKTLPPKNVRPFLPMQERGVEPRRSSVRQLEAQRTAVKLAPQRRESPPQPDATRTLPEFEPDNFGMAPSRTSHADNLRGPDLRDAKLAPGRRTPLEVIAHVADRAVRLSLDAVVLIVFSPLILVWQLSERRKRANGKKV